MAGYPLAWVGRRRLGYLMSCPSGRTEDTANAAIWHY